MKILIIYGTTEGQTRKIARFMEEQLQAKGHRVTIADATEEPPIADDFEVVLIGSSVHIHKYNNAVKHYINHHIDALNSRPMAFFSVSMAVASQIEEEHDDIQQLANDFMHECGLTEPYVFHIAGALRYTKYDYFKRLLMRMIAQKEGGSTDTSKDHEYTDWENIKSDLFSFIDQAER